MNHKQFVEDLIEAQKKAAAAAEKMDDGGSANLDAAFIRLPRVRETKALEDFKLAGLYCRGKRKWIGTGYMIHPNVPGQGNQRATGVRVFVKELSRKGYDIMTYSKMD